MGRPTGASSKKQPKMSITAAKRFRRLGHPGALIKSEAAGSSQLKACRADFARFRANGYSGWGSEGFWALALYRFQKVIQRQRAGWFWAPVRFALRFIRKIFVLMTLIDIHPDAEIGPGLIIPHGGPIRVHGDAKIGTDCSLNHMC